MKKRISKLKSFAFSAILLCFVLNTVGQETFIQTYNRSGKDKGYGIADLKATGNIYLAGKSRIASDTALSILTVNSTGTFVDTTLFNLVAGSQSEGAFKIKATSDGGFIVLGYKPDPSVGGLYNAHAIKLNANLVKTWEITLSDILTELPNGPFYDVIESSTGGFIFSGYFSNSNGIGIKVDNNGTLVWSKPYRYIPESFCPTSTYSVLEMHNGNFLFIGKTFNSTSCVSTGTEQYAAYWAEADKTTGTRQNHNLTVSSTPGVHSEAFTGAKTPNGYLLAGYEGTQLLLISTGKDIDLGGSVTKVLIDVDLIRTETSIDYADIEKTKDDMYVITGTYTDNTGKARTFLIKVNESGTVQWRKTFEDVITNNHVRSYNVINSYEGGLLIGGYHQSTDLLTSKFHIIKLDAAGELCNFTGIPIVSVDTTVMGTPVTFTPTLLQESGAETYAWNINGAVYNVRNPQHTFGAAGTYNIFLEVTKGLCKSHYQDSLVITGPLVIADFTYTNTGTTVNFTNTSQNTNAQTTYSWDFGDTFTSDQANPSHTYTSGIYTVCLTVNNGYSTDSVCKVIDVTMQAPVADFCYIAYGRKIQFVDESSYPEAWFWNLQDPPADPDYTIQNPEHTYTFDGTDFVSLKVFNSMGNNTTNTRKIFFNANDTTPRPNFTYTANGYTATFTDKSLYDRNVWEWDFNQDGITDNTTQNPSYTFPAAGAYSVCLRVKNVTDPADIYECVFDTCISIVISAPPVAQFTYINNEDLSVTFVDQSTNFPTTWAWDFDQDGVIDEASQNPTHTFPAIGSYSVCLIVTNTAGADTICQDVEVEVPAPIAAFNISPADGCEGQSVVFTDASLKNKNQWTWNFGVGATPATANTQGPHTVTYSTSGTKTIKLVVTGAGGTDSITRTFTVYPTPSAAVAGTDQNLNCQTSTVLNATPPTTGTGQWSVVSGSGTFTDNTDPATTVSGLAAGNNVLRWTVTSGPCANVDDITINVSGISQASAGTDQQLCAVTTATLNAVAAASGETGTWSVITGTGSFNNVNDPNTVVTGLSTGLNELMWTVSKTGCTSTIDVVNVTVDQQPTPPNAGADVDTCSVTSVQLNANTPTVGLGTWTKISGSGTIANTNNAQTSITGLTPGTSVFRWTITNSSCTLSDDVTVNVYSIPVTSVIQGDNSVCASTSNVYSVTSTAGSSYLWTVPAGASITSGQGTSQITVLLGNASGDVTVIETNTNACQGATRSLAVTVLDCDNPPLARFVYSKNGFIYTFTDSSLGGPVKWKWNLGDGNSSSLQNIIHEYQLQGEYNVCLSIENLAGLTDDTCMMISVYPTGVDENGLNNNVQIFPNPVKDNFTIMLPHFNNEESIKVKVYNSIGSIIRTELLTPSLPAVSINMEQEAVGVYYITLESSKEIITRRIILAR